MAKYQGTQESCHPLFYRYRTYCGTNTFTGVENNVSTVQLGLLSRSVVSSETVDAMYRYQLMIIKYSTCGSLWTFVDLSCSTRRRFHETVLKKSPLKIIHPATLSLLPYHINAVFSMNLELLDPFGRQVPDRVDATIELADLLHYPPNHIQDELREQEEWKAAYHVAYNRRGTYLAVGHASGTVAVHCALNRTLAALYYSPAFDSASYAAMATAAALNHGCSSLSWARRSRALLAGSAGDKGVRLYDTTHPAGPDECSAGLFLISGAAVGDEDDDGEISTVARSSKPIKVAAASTTDEVLPTHTYLETQHTPFRDADRRYIYVKTARKIATVMLEKGGKVQVAAAAAGNSVNTKAQTRKTKYPCVYFAFPHAVSGSLQINPRRPNAGLAVLSNGSLVLFWVPVSAYVDDNVDATAPSCTVLSLYDADPVACAAFDPRGDQVYAVSKEGMLMGFRIANIWKVLSSDAVVVSIEKKKQVRLPNCDPAFRFSISAGKTSGEGVAVWHSLVSRNGKFLILNSADGAIRLYTTHECWELAKGKSTIIEKPTWVFQDVVTKVKFASCDLSGDGEYVVGGANGADNKYELYIWNTSTGALMDKLTGASTKLYSVAWHPTRSFLAVACADGLVDIWGPRINWTAFAPDFQALPMNVEYIEREDEFDVDENGVHLAASHDAHTSAAGNESAIVDVMTIEPVPVFASDSEEEENVFAFETRVVAGRAEKPSKKSGAAVDE